LIGCCRGGYENINIDAARKKGVIVVNAPGRTANAVAEFTIGLMIAEARNIARGHHALKSGIWRKNYVNDEYRMELRDKVIGIIGFGNIGRRVAQLLKAFNVKTILVYDPYIPNEEIVKAGCEPADLRRIFQESDFITIHARLTKESVCLINRELISLMKRTAYIINTARAGLIDYNALYEALKERRIGGAALDVFDLEPLPSNSPWLELDNVTLTPHLAGDTIETRLNGIIIISEEIAAFLEGRPLHNRVV
jgi:D-3-phosphoglycerate dehydrogenase